ncbi:thioredoxin fold domain-containing protein [Campylobacter suis]|uniref:Thioredoxin-like fold domain-containing protein n=1 Tax=Campylobacter suis TaxID=2790657 RepID=A0ABM8Q0I3_9BACT|nr:thioredoxin fold domain-containing protein [Campylobacter suis]CAD7286327.1 hypothetical protein LMG8286_00158 [Campylobacter suis]
MKKILLLSAVAASSLFALTNEQILDFYKQIVPSNVKIEVASRQKVENNTAYEAVILKVTEGDQSNDMVVFTRDDLIFNDILDLKNMTNYKQVILDKMLASKLKDVYKKEDKKYIISLGDDAKKPTTVIFTDPECPYCRLELANIEKRLVNENVKMILTPVHDKSALEKSHLIYKEIASAKSDSEKVKIMRKYYDQNAVVPEKSVSEAEVKKMDDLRKKYFNAGVNSVPKIISEDSLK